MQRVKNKLRSQRGASFSFALLLFLICAVISSVIIVAATASSGRLALIAQMDQRYYAVTSAAALLRDLIDGQEVEVTVTHTVTTPDEGEKEERTEKRIGDTLVTDQESLDSLLEDLANHLVISQAIDPEGEEPFVFSDDITRADLSLDLLELGERRLGDSLSALTVTISQTLYPDGTLVYELKNAQGKPYTLTMTFLAERSSSTDSETQVQPPTEEDPEGSLGTTVQTTVTTTKLTWHFDQLSDAS